VHGSISGVDYAKSVVFGAGAGLLSTVIPGAGGVVVGGALAGINDAYNQSINTQNGEIDWSAVGDFLLSFYTQRHYLLRAELRSYCCGPNCGHTFPRSGVIAV